MLNVELGVAPDSEERGLIALGMIVINPPWMLETQKKEVLS
ncbi:23S rRNA (adenine(2030)-N(6))-methyltransferase RlmJ [Candidatus Enterovibrio altilux]|nr:23S rRNA (adenine(2030)-N(6))-methyltransferase RlmJ [Candidatus Enterovibrio luxaltus]